MESAGRLKQVKHRRCKNIWSVIVCALTSDVETHFPFNVTFCIPDSVAAFVCTCDGAENDVALVDANTTLVALPGHPCTGQQHQSRSAGGKSQRVWTFLHFPG